MTKDEFKNIYDQGFEDTWQEIKRLNKTVLDLQSRLKMDSTNSSKPSSTDIAKKKKNNSRKKSGKKSGGQPGHKGKSLSLNKEPDKTKKCDVGECQCGHHFNGDETVINVEKRQVIDIPQPVVETTEYIAVSYKCPECGNIHSAEFPKGVSAPVQYGNNLRSYVIYLMNYQFTPYKRTTDLLENLHNLPISEGTLANIIKDFAGRLDLPISFIKQQIIESEVVHLDESGLYVEGAREWLHVACTDLYTFYFPHKSRGKIALDEADILPNFIGTACHDHWKTYYSFDNCIHSLCNAHHLRELQGIIDKYNYEWAIEMKKLLSYAKKQVDAAVEKEEMFLTSEKIAEIERNYKKIIKNGYLKTPKPPVKETGKRGKQGRGKALCLLDRLSQKKKEVLDFIYDFTRPFDNNQAERDIRMIKIKQKISGTFRSKKGSENFCKIRSYISTAIKHEENVFDAIKDIYTGSSFLEEYCNST